VLTLAGRSDLVGNGLIKYGYPPMQMKCNAPLQITVTRRYFNGLRTIVGIFCRGMTKVNLLNYNRKMG